MDKEQPGSVISPGGSWHFKPEVDEAKPAPARPQPSAQTPGLQWEAAEFVAQHKNIGWYALLAGGAVVVSALVYLLTHDRISTGMIIVVALALGVFAARQPRALQYKLDETGLTIGTKFYSFSNFKSFALVDEGELSAIWLVPLQRFMPVITVYYPPKDEQKITNLLSQILPFEPRTHDTLERFMRKIRF